LSSADVYSSPKIEGGRLQVLITFDRLAVVVAVFFSWGSIPLSTISVTSCYSNGSDRPQRRYRTGRSIPLAT